MSNKALETLVDLGLLKTQYRTEFKSKDPGQINDINKLAKTPEIETAVHEMVNRILAAQNNVNKTANVFNPANVELFPNLIPEDEAPAAQHNVVSLDERRRDHEALSVGTSATTGFLEEAPATPPEPTEYLDALATEADSTSPSAGLDAVELRREAMDAAESTNPYETDNPWVERDAA